MPTLNQHVHQQRARERAAVCLLHRDMYRLKYTYDAVQQAEWALINELRRGTPTADAIREAKACVEV